MRTHLYPLKEKGGRDKKRKDLEVLTPPPLYIPPPALTAPVLNGLPELANPGESESDHETQGPVTRSRARNQKSALREGLYPLREIAMGGPQPGMEYVAIPINSGDV